MFEHDDVIKWKQFPRYWSFVRGIHRSPVKFPAQRPVTRSFDVFFDRRPKYGWVNNREVGDLRRHRAHCDVSVVTFCESALNLLHGGLSTCLPSVRYYFPLAVQKLIKNDTWVVVNNDVFGHKSFANDFQRWCTQERILLANHPKSDQQLVIRGNPFVILFLTCFSGVKHSEIDESSNRSIATPLLFKLVQSVVVLWRHGNT